ncbi:flagellar M-ring protein [Caldalkalibacillus thermarum]|uniref:flagellar basal-body MS-ring/collar protein FliF n=1 Tax=Caldalkalibacillus thermarum TaxID=296745 RepID=UPI001664061A|nr:flagellar basal-body MS-ring/collar protein FliF [Caldalkalibacillus thermarum]GGK13770.1 flagellar M-ring protein [Caldalkalibacillus thermarum]
MKEKIQHYKDQFIETWKSLTNKQKWLVIGSFVFISLALALLIYWASRPQFVPIYTNLSPVEAGEIMEAIESRGIPAQLSQDGRTISVPKSEASRLKVELAHAGIPRSGNINYSIFSENMGWGTTDRQLDVVERDAMQNELRYLIEQIEGIEQAKVMITLPKESVWLSDEEQTATASVVVHTRPGLNLGQSQINGLYHLISKSVPHLPPENIVIMNQNMEPLELRDEDETGNHLALHQQHRRIKRDIEQDIQRELQLMLGRIFGMENVIVSVFANVDFSKESREEQLVEPVVDDNGLAISIERIEEIFQGQGDPPGGIAGTGETDVTGYQGTLANGDSEYERIEERINQEVNRIYRQIESSPYQITDLSINVGLDESIYMPQTEEAVRELLTSVLHTYVDAAETELDEEQLEQRITIFAQPFQEQPPVADETGVGIRNWLVYVLAAALAAALGGLAFVVVRQRRQATEEEDELEIPEEIEPDLISKVDEQPTKRSQIEQLAKERPAEFVKLLKSWMAED